LYPAAVAGRCANEQGKFWEYREALFERQKDLSAEHLQRWAAELGLDRDEFAECLESKRYEEASRQSIESGRKAGVNVAPRVFVNGVPFQRCGVCRGVPRAHRRRALAEGLAWR
jgi:protein-disulfide isomerase